MNEHLGKPTELDDVEKVLGYLVQLQQRASALFVERRNQRGAGDPTRIQTMVLRHLFDRGQASVSEIAEILRVSTPTASQLLNTMGERGWVTVNFSPEDRRRHVVQLSPQGATLLAERSAKRLASVRKVLLQMTPDERATLISLVDRMVTLWVESDIEEGSSGNGE